MRWTRESQPGGHREWVRTGTVTAVALACALLWLGGPPAAAAATFGGVGSLANPSTDPVLIAAQLRKSIALQRRAMEQLYSPQVPETLQGVAQLLNEAYVLTRAAHDGITRKIDRQRGDNNQGYVDPSLVWQDQTLASSRRHILRATEGLKGATGPESIEQVERRIEDIEEAIRLNQRVLGTVR